MIGDGGGTLSSNHIDRAMLPGFAEAGLRTEDQWEFTSANTQYLTHGLFPYPARMIPQIADRLISLYWPDKATSSSLVADVFCGSGTVLVEASLKGIPSVGTDINPFAVFLSKAKTTAIDVSTLTPIKEQLRVDLEAFDGTPIEAYVPSFTNLSHWFKPGIIAQLSHLRRAIDHIANEDLQRVFGVAFAHAIMKCSNVDWKSSRYLRVLPESKLESHNPDAFTFFWGNLGNIERKLASYGAKKKANVEVRQDDACSLSFSDDALDLIVTSPPYGEEMNTIPYIRWARLFLLWLGFSQTEIKSVEDRSLGGAGKDTILQGSVPSATFWEAVDEVAADRLKEAVPFMVDYLSSLNEMQRILRPGCRACIVIGHRSISRTLIDMGKVTQELGEAAGLKFETIYYRNIPKKMIPWTGPTGETIGQESIVILRK